MEEGADVSTGAGWKAPSEIAKAESITSRIGAGHELNTSMFQLAVE